jgi:hypothetical protein
VHVKPGRLDRVDQDNLNPVRPARATSVVRTQRPPEGLLSCHMVGTSVNSVRNEGPELVTPLPPSPGGAGTGSAIMAESYSLFESELPGA